MTRQLGFMCIRYVGTSCAVQHLPWQRCAVPLWRHNIQHPSAAAEIASNTARLNWVRLLWQDLGMRPAAWYGPVPLQAVLMSWPMGLWQLGAPRSRWTWVLVSGKKCEQISILYACIGVLFAQYRLPNAQ